jgi:xanthine dehydrogenase YagS FAD-binding subunit
MRPFQYFLKSHVETPGKVVNLLRIPNLAGIHADGNGLRIGALTTLAEIASTESVRRGYAALAQACDDAATPQVRNVATIAGNLCQRPRCWYFRSGDFACLKKGGKSCLAHDGDNRYHAIFDTRPCPIVHPSNAAPALLALGAVVRTHAEGGGRELPIDRFLTRPSDNIAAETALQSGEVITEIFVPGPPRSSAYREVRQKESFDYALASCAVAGRFEGTTVREIRVVLGAVAPVPRLAGEAARLLQGKTITPELAAEAGALALKDATPLSQNGYKVQMARVAVKRALLAAAGLEK